MRILSDILINEVNSFKNNIVITIKHLFKRLLQSPLLLGWIIIGMVIEIINDGYKGFIITIINLILLLLFTLIIKVMTDNLPAKPILKLKRPKLELFLGILLCIFICLEICIFFGQVEIPYLSNFIINLTSYSTSNILKLGQDSPQWLLSALVNASNGIILELIPIIILFLILGYGFKKMGVLFTNLPLILVLLGVTIILGLPFKVLFHRSLYQSIILFFIMIFVNALPEELIVRGYILPRLEAVLKNPINALVISSLLFNMMHIPSYLIRDMSTYHVLFQLFSVVSPTGLIWGYLYLKTRSIVPGVIWHASNTILGIIFILI